MKLAIFDMDGTLFDTRQANYMAYKQALNEFGFDVNREYYFDFCNGKYYMDFLPQLVGEDKEILQKIHALKKECYQEFLGEVIPNKHLLHILKSIRGEYKTALVTSASKKNVETLLSYFKVINLFDIIVTQENVKRKKPDPEGFLYAMREFDADFEETFIFEDSPEGIEAARRTGAQVFVVNTDDRGNLLGYN